MKNLEFPVLLDLEKISEVPATRAPFPFLTAANVLDAQGLEDVARDFPRIDQPGIFPLGQLSYGGAFARLIEDIRRPELGAMLGAKLGVDLSDKPLMVTVRGHCQKKDGRIHVDSKDKIVTCLLYLNPATWPAEGGRLRLLRERDDLDSTIAEVAPTGGTFVAFRRTDCSWHGHAPYVGPRRYIMFNWLQSEAVLAKNLLRHRISAMFKRFAN